MSKDTSKLKQITRSEKDRESDTSEKELSIVQARPKKEL